MKSMSVTTFISMAGAAFGAMTPKLEENLTKEFEKYEEPKSTRINDRILVLRSLVAKGYDPKKIATVLNTQTYNVTTALDKRKSLGEKEDWSVRAIRNSLEWKHKKWTQSEFQKLLTKPTEKSGLNYSRLKEFEADLVE